MALAFLSPIHKATRQIGIYLEESTTADGMSPSEGHLLAYLKSYGPCPVGELHRVFGHKRSTLTSMLDRLEARTWLRRDVKPGDRRTFLVELTPAGIERADRVQHLVEELESRIMDRLDPSDLSGFQSVMQAIADVTRVEVRPARPPMDPRPEETS